MPSMGSGYTDEQRREAISVYAVMGNIKKAAEFIGMPNRTIQDWVNSEWGQELLTTVRMEKQSEIVAAYHNVVDLSLKAMTDRVVHGDSVLNKDGDLVKKPVCYRDLVIGAGTGVDKIRLLLNQATSITVTDGALTKISKQLEAYAVDKQEKVINP